LPNLLSNTWASRWVVGTRRANWDLPFHPDQRFILPTPGTSCWHTGKTWSDMPVISMPPPVSLLGVRCEGLRAPPTSSHQKISAWSLIGAIHIKISLVVRGTQGQSISLNVMYLSSSHGMDECQWITIPRKGLLEYVVTWWL
jgi:hypothetical protein